MSAPRIEISLAKVEHNTRVLVERLSARGIGVVGVTKAALGSPGVAAAMLRGGAVGLGDARLENLARLAGADLPGRTGRTDGSVSRTLIRSPMLSQADGVVRTAAASLNTGPAVIAALDRAATAAGVRHGVVLMVELGDLREGIAVADVEAAVRVVLGCRSVDLLGLGANLACQNGVVPDDDNMGTLGRLVEQVEARIHRTLAVVSSGNSANLEWALTTSRLARTNQLRLGESILLGTEPLHRSPIAGLHTDAFTVFGEVIESAVKPLQPWGNRAQAAYGAPPVRASRGSAPQAIVALGRQDVDVDGITPLLGIGVLGMSSDHLVLDTGDHVLAVGDELAFGLDYAALVRAMTSPFVAKVELAAP